MRLLAIFAVAATLAGPGMEAVAMPSHVPPDVSGAFAPAERIRLPAVRPDSDTSIEKALFRRRSVREYRPAPLTLGEVAQLLWAAQGITEPREGLRTSPSAGATYPLEVFAVVSNAEGLRKGVYRYRPLDHELALVRDGDVAADLAAAALGQAWVARCAVALVIAAVYERTTRRYGERGIRYVHMETGHAAQNVYLQAVALGLGTVVVGAFDDERVRRVLSLPEREHPLYIMPVGRV